MSDKPIICQSCGEENPAGTKACNFCTLPLISQSDRSSDEGTRIINSDLEPKSTEFAPGSLIANRYEILRELGRGGMGAVYLVADEKLVRKEVALKIISPDLVDSLEMRKRFVQEVLAAQELFHKNIIRVYHFDEYQGLQFFTMEYLPGKSLREVMTSRFDAGRFFSIDESTAVLSPVLSALAHAHSKNVIHRDLKPENIIINGALPDITVKVLDFGLARIMSPSRLTSTAVAMGTAYYMSPEQLAGRGEVDHRTDLYPVGVILYELLTGDIPSGRFKLPGELIDGLTSGIDEVVERSLAPKPMDRFQTADEFDTAINQLSDAQATTNFLGIKFVFIEPGTFMMGSASNKPGRFRDERQHSVTMTQGYYIQTTPMTVGQWRAFIQDIGYKTEAETDGGSYMWSGSKWEKKAGIYWANPGFSQADSHPVTCVSWNDVQKYIAWLNRKDTGTYRLPTEAEWEYAARAGRTSAYHFGNSESDLTRYAWYRNNSGRRTQPVAQKLLNAWGLYDMHGNVWEWVEDWYGDYPNSMVTDPTGPSSGTDRVLRGGCRMQNRMPCGAGERQVFKENFGFHNATLKTGANFIHA